MIKAAHSAAAVLELEEAAHAIGLTMLSLVHDTGHTRTAKTKNNSVCCEEKVKFRVFFFVSVKLHSSDTVAASVEMNSETQEWQRAQTDTCATAARTCACLRPCDAFHPSAGGTPLVLVQFVSLAQRHRQPPYIVRPPRFTLANTAGHI